MLKESEKQNSGNRNESGKENTKNNIMREMKSSESSYGQSEYFEHVLYILKLM